MARPKTKDELLSIGVKNYNKLIAFIDAMPDQNKELPQGYLNRNVRDVLGHLHHWHTMMLDWYDVGMNGGNPDMPAKGYTWRTVPDLNRVIWESFRARSLQEVSDLLDTSFLQLQSVIESHTEEELFTKKKYSWTGSTSLASYLISATSSHYDWALKLLKKI